MISSFPRFRIAALGTVLLATVSAHAAPKPETLIEVMPFHSGAGTLALLEGELGTHDGYIAWRLHRENGDILVVLARQASKDAAGPRPWMIHTGIFGEQGATIRHSAAAPCNYLEAELYVSPAKESLALICVDKTGEVQRLDVNPLSGTVKVVDARMIQG